MADTPKSGLAAAITLKFTDADTLGEALRTYSGQHGMGGLCIQVVKYYELGDQLQLTVDYGAMALPIRGVVAWRKPGFIGVRFQPMSAAENKSLLFFRTLIGEAKAGPPSAAPGPPVLDTTKP